MEQYSKLLYWRGLLWSQSCGNWIYNYLCNQCLLPVELWVQILLMVDTTLCDEVW